MSIAQEAPTYAILPLPTTLPNFRRGIVYSRILRAYLTVYSQTRRFGA